MPLVPRAVRAGLAALATAIPLVAGVGCEGDSPGRGRGGAGDLRLVACRDWQSSNIKERRRTVDLLERFAGGPSGSPGGHGVTVEDARAYLYIDTHCRQGYAANVKLYKLYTRAAAFQKLVR